MKTRNLISLLTAMVLTLASCTPQNTRLSTHPPLAASGGSFPSPNTLPEISTPGSGPGLLIGIFAAAAVGGLILSLTHQHKKVRLGTLDTRGGRVRLLAHQEAPSTALFLGDVEVQGHRDATAVKNALRNRAAEMGGNLLVLDTLTSENDPWGTPASTTTTYSGTGRVYRLADSSHSAPPPPQS